MTPGRATQADVARLAGVSRQLVSLVVRGDPRVADSSRESVEAAIAAVGYRPNLAARTLVMRRSGLIGVVFSGLTNPFYGELAEALRAHGEAQGFIPLISTVAEDPDRESAVVERFLELGVDGLVLVAPLLSLEALERLGAALPTVILTRNQGPANVDLVRSDDVLGTRLVTEELHSRGYAPLIHLGPARQAIGDSSVDRVRGFTETVAALGVPGDVVIAGDAEIAGRVRDVLRRTGPGVGFACHNDLVALRVFGAVIEEGLVVGRDVGIAGFDNTMLTGLAGISLTSVDTDTAALAEGAVSLLRERQEGRTGRRDLIVPPRLVPRASTRRA